MPFGTKFLITDNKAIIGAGYIKDIIEFIEKIDGKASKSIDINKKKHDNLKNFKSLIIDFS